MVISSPSLMKKAASVYTDSQEGRCGLAAGGGLSSSHLDWIIQLLKSMRAMLLESEAQDQTFL